MQRPSVLFINRVYPPSRGATGRVLRDLAKSFARAGWQVTIVTTGPKALREKDGPIRVIRVKGSAKPHLLLYPWIWIKLWVAALRAPKAHLVVSMTDPPFTALIGHMVSRAWKARHIHWCQDLYPDVFPALGVAMPGFVRNGLYALGRYAMRRADKVIVIGRCMAKNLTCSGFDPQRITVIPNWPDRELARPAAAQKHYRKMMEDAQEVEGSKAYDDLVKGGPKFRVLYAGNIGLAHPLDPILAAAKALNDNHPEIEFVFVGEGPRFDRIAGFRSAHGLENIRLLPYQPNSRLREVMESGDVHLISMKDDAAGCLVPSKLYSALAVSRPSIFVGPEQSEAAKVIHDFEAGCIVAANDTQGLIKAITHYRMDGDAWFSAHEGARHAAGVFVPEQAMEAWIKRAWAVISDDIGGRKSS